MCLQNQSYGPYHDHDQDTKWVGISSLKSVKSYGCYYLLNDVTTTDEGWGSDLDDVRICLNGHNIILENGYYRPYIHVTNYHTPVSYTHLDVYKRQVLEAALRRAGATFLDGAADPPADRTPITKADLFCLGLSGGKDSQLRRREMLRRLDLPEHMGANALLSVLNALYSREEFLREADAWR